jgi:hypothetical protein
MDVVRAVSIRRSISSSIPVDCFARFRLHLDLSINSTSHAIFATSISSGFPKEQYQLTKSWLYSRLKRARRFSGLLAAALLPAAGLSEVPAIKRDHYRKYQRTVEGSEGMNSYKVHGWVGNMFVEVALIYS